jgi:HEAT repeat protein
MMTIGRQNPDAQKPAAASTRKGKPEITPEFKAEPIEKLDQAGLVKILAEPGAESAAIFRKSIACKRLAVIGTKEAVPALAALLGDDRASDYARSALEAIPDPAAGEALVAALPRLKGLQAIGAINSIGRRREPAAVESLGKLIQKGDADMAGAAALALGEISGPKAAQALERELRGAKGRLRADVARGALLCADRMMGSDRVRALALLDLLSRPDIPGIVRIPAMHLQVSAAASLKRPRPGSGPGTED